MPERSLLTKHVKNKKEKNFFLKKKLSFSHTPFGSYKRQTGHHFKRWDPDPGFLSSLGCPYPDGKTVGLVYHPRPHTQVYPECRSTFVGDDVCLGLDLGWAVVRRQSYSSPVLPSRIVSGTTLASDFL